ncbi:MAG: beta-galactosidase [Lachnospiraceae bacterium]|nr:beta-galactosidase [Lachnospiraceae bacterium]
MRVLIDLKENWYFSKKQTAVPDRLPEDDSWEKISLPHTWNAVDGHDGSGFDRGAYWYVTAFEAPEQPLPGGRTYIEVGAAALVGDVYVNGVFLTRHVGGFSAFRADATDVLKKGCNILAIRCDNTYSEKVYPQRADFTFYGGLYRYVKVISVPESHFSLDYYGSSGVLIDTEIKDGHACISARVFLTDTKPGMQVRLEILDAEGKTVSEAWKAAEDEMVLETSVPSPRLWNGTDGAYLYTARLQLVNFNEVLDEVQTSFGIRDFSLDAEKGFFLNGRSYNLRGVCRHQDRLYQGNALSKEDHYEDARIIADMGANAIRLAHYQQSHDIYDACDELGLCVWAEIPYFATTWDDDAHAAAVNEIKEMTAQNYNHPSIFFWGLSNEILMRGNDNPKLLGCHRDLNEAVKSIDQKRYTVIAHEFGAGWDHPLHEISDAEGWNHYFGWYRGEMDGLAEWLDEYHKAYPERMISVSEYGCDAVIRYHSDDPKKMDYSEEYQVLIHENACETFAARPFVWGSFVWNMFDFGSSFRREGGTAGRNNKGLVTMDRKIKKDAYYVYKAWFSKDPFVHVDGRRYFDRPGSTTVIRVHSNLPEVSLYIDGKLFGKKAGEHTFIFENVPLAKAGTTVTAAAGDCADTVRLCGGAENNLAFTFPEFKEAQDAKNWFEGVDDIAGDLITSPGFWSVHDTMAEVSSCPEAMKIVTMAVTGAAERVVADTLYKEGDLNLSVAEFLGTGYLGIMLGGRLDQTIRRIHSALSKLPKE